VKAESITEILSWTPPEVRTIIGNNEEAILVPQGKAIIFGEFGSWKSMLSLDLGIRVSYGMPWLGFRTAHQRVAYLQTEISKLGMHQRLSKYIPGNKIPLPVPNFWSINEHYYKLDRDITSELGKMLIQHRIQLLIIDPIYMTTSGDVAKGWDTQQLLTIVDDIINKYRVAVILIGHVKKPSKDGQGKEVAASNQGYELMGSSFFANWADTLIHVEPVRQLDGSVILNFVKVRHSSRAIPSVGVKIDRATLHASYVYGRLSDNGLAEVSDESP
jgi:RecA-family ATPase